METKQTGHTPGPWWTATANQWGTIEGTEIRVQGIGYEHGTIGWACSNGGTGDAACKANARLIAAAPELLRALEDLAAEINLSKLNIRKDFSLINAHAAAIKAINKATT